MFLSAATRLTCGALRHSVRSFSVCNASGIGIKERMRKFITENPHLVPAESQNLNLPTVKQLTQTQLELLKQIEEIDTNHFLYPGEPLITREQFHQFGNGEVDGHFTRANVLYRDLPHRCYCGNWFKLVDVETYEKAREMKWEKLKNDPYNAELMEKFAEAQKKMNALLEKGKTMTTKSPNVNDFLIEMNQQWKSLLGIYKEIRNIMELR